jgi:hypothetical protein
MAKPGQRSDVNNFIGGLVTEASVLNFPANASADEQNFELDRTGLRTRRLGMNFEPDFENIVAGPTSVGIVSAGFNTFRWESVGGDPNTNYAVIQVDQRLNFFDLSKNAITEGGTNGVMDLTVFPVGVRYSFASVEGYLVVVAGAEQFAIISRNFVANTLFVTYGVLKRCSSLSMRMTLRLVLLSPIRSTITTFRINLGASQGKALRMSK